MRWDALTGRRQRKTTFKRHSMVGRFLTSEYGISWRDIAAKGRLALLEDVESVPCNLCGDTDATPVAARDKYGLPVTTVMCRRCGLLYLNPRPVAAAYARFYEGGGGWTGAYHRHLDVDALDEVLSWYFGSDFSMSPGAKQRLRNMMRSFEAEPDRPPRKTLLGKLTGRWRRDPASPIHTSEAKTYAMQVYEAAGDLVPRGGAVFEVGASWGRMLLPWRELHDCQVTGVEPKHESVRTAHDRLGLDLFEGFSDNGAIPSDAYDLVLNTRTINHQLDPLGDLRRAERWLKDDGIIFVDIVDAVDRGRRIGFERNTVEIDHPYMFTMNTLAALVQRAGYEVIRREAVDQPKGRRLHVFGRKVPSPASVDWPSFDAEWTAFATISPSAPRRLIEEMATKVPR